MLAKCLDLLSHNAKKQCSKRGKRELDKTKERPTTFLFLSPLCSPLSPEIFHTILLHLQVPKPLEKPLAFPACLYPANSSLLLLRLLWALFMFMLTKFSPLSSQVKPSHQTRGQMEALLAQWHRSTPTPPVAKILPCFLMPSSRHSTCSKGFGYISSFQHKATNVGPT